jgi:hypothetical protein
MRPLRLATIVCAFIFLEWGFRRGELMIFVLNSPITDVRSFVLLSQVFEDVGELLIFVWKVHFNFNFLRQARQHTLVQSRFSPRRETLRRLPAY